MEENNKYRPKTQVVFKMPTLTRNTPNTDVQNRKIEETPVTKEKDSSESSVLLAYKEPPWSGLPQSEVPYHLEVLKSGVIIEKVKLMSKAYWVFGRLKSCDVCMVHPTISRHHAILQYNAMDSKDRPPGFYIYDLGSTHGTYLNKNRIKPNMYVRVQVGHLVKFGCSSRTYLLMGPEDDIEMESELTVTELKQNQAEKAKAKGEKQKPADQDKGIDWGMGEDADEETDLMENPYAETNNEHLYINDPKKALRHYMEREGAELRYDVTERGLGQYFCTVVLPIDDANGRPVVAEVLLRGRKKEAVAQCALEACRILDRHGVLRQATQETFKRRAKNWEENDYYDSDEDPFLDRTGTIERKRAKRMSLKQSSQQPQAPLTYQTLLAQQTELNKQMETMERQLSEAEGKRLDSKNSGRDPSQEVDTLDQFMSELDAKTLHDINKLKRELQRLKKELAENTKLLNIARPAELPPIIPVSKNSEEVSSTSYDNHCVAKPEEVDNDKENSEGNPSTSTALSLHNNCAPNLNDCGIPVRIHIKSLSTAVRKHFKEKLTTYYKIAEGKGSIAVDEEPVAVQPQARDNDLDNVSQDSGLDEENEALMLEMMETRKQEDSGFNEASVSDIAEIRKQLSIDFNEALMSDIAKTRKQQDAGFNKAPKLDIAESRKQQDNSSNEALMLDIAETNKQLDTGFNKAPKSDIAETRKQQDTGFNKASKSDMTEIHKQLDTGFNKASKSDIAETCKELDTGLDGKKEETRYKEDELGEASVKEASPNKKKLSKQYNENELKENYSLWVPPEGQTGDGKTSLNDKFGY